MGSGHYDFLILGDTQPEGLLLASALARRSYSVGLVSSEALGELPSQNPWPIRFPDRFGSYRFDELLFRAGFFRLEDSGLEPSPTLNQFLLPKHRVSLDGSQSTWIREMGREFPQLHDRIVKLKAQLLDEKRKAHIWGAKLQSLIRIDREFEQLALLECFEGRHLNRSARQISKDLVRTWKAALQNQEAKVFRVRSDLSQPYNQFLLEHARKWGVQVIEEAPQLKLNWRSVEFLPQRKARYVMANTLAGAKLLHQLRPQWMPHPISHWLYFDRILCAFDDLPEPLGEFVYLSADPAEERPASVSILHVQRDRLRDQAQLTLGTWLSFDESRAWQEDIQKSRQRLQRTLPFLGESHYPAVPSTLELAEMKGECIRRAELERLLFDQVESPSRAQGLQRKLKQWMRSRRKDFLESSRLLSCLPFVGPRYSRRESLQQCLKALDYFEGRRSASRAGARP